MSMTPFSEVPLEGLRPSVSVVPADLTVVVDVQAVELVQPVGDGFAVPAQRQVLGL